ncbi:glycoside hydrolase family 13 protein [Candidatus Rhodoluna planktonica]|uniref:Alpha-amylase n=1 Tax=Candidatus Rhodoluna planktonica TaxID=535712 RepID=A0A1D9DXS1_9MICO|nr:glycoside hydrolase family 13 protein [Candidatus Rhodoluna planktonica]AOY55603.1 alpha-amylase [Candidatus Rhodoluna planktonica]
MLNHEFLTVNNPSAEWWRKAVIYQVYPRSFADADGDGIGDLKGITEKLGSLSDLGIDAIWFSPFFKSPQKDAGYDISDYRLIDPIFGTNEDFDVLLAKAKTLGIRIIVDIVPNHTSDQHAWFQAALASAPGSAERDYYHFRDGKGENGELPPNNWQSIFGGPAWSRITEANGELGQWYLHLFDSSQPDLNWENPKIADEFDDILRFWLDKGVDGFRVDVAHGMVKRAGLPDATIYDENLRERPISNLTMAEAEEAVPYWGQPGVHDAIRRFRRIIDEYDDRAMCAEASMSPLPRLAMWVRPDEYHQSFNFDYMHSKYEAAAIKKIVTDSIVEYGKVGASSTWVLSNHDGIRHATRLGIAPENTPRPGDGIHPSDPAPDEALGLRRARAATAFMLGLPGSSYLYQGEELGLPEAWQLEGKYRQDPTYARTNGDRIGRDGCRVPLPWVADATESNGFNSTGKSWLPQPANYRVFARNLQEGVVGSTLELYKRLLKVRKQFDLGAGAFSWVDDYDSETSLSYINNGVLVITNFSGGPIAMPAGELLVTTQHDLTVEGILEHDQTVWLKLS